MGNVTAQRVWSHNNADAKVPHTPAQSCDAPVVPHTAEKQASASGRSELLSNDESETGKGAGADYSRHDGRISSEQLQRPCSLDFGHCEPQDEPMIGRSEQQPSSSSSSAPPFASQVPQHYDAVSDAIPTQDQCAYIERGQRQHDWLVFSQLRILVRSCSGFDDDGDLDLNLNASK